MSIRVNNSLIWYNALHHDTLCLFNILDIFNKSKILDLLWVNASTVFPAK